ncbi:hypothetical protein DEO72_LG5g1502 [Vigna unguiculata]|uniref:Uncharacterized protein n=1 Tax=Vigna unguiculata TaxID=3917 RepID=A0A4D6LXL0_VIGUN|nr:hypothetical protein DEO72_LG5g1502 [Vigna unguiculata]
MSTSRTQDARPLLSLFSSVTPTTSASTLRATIDNVDHLSSFLSDHRDQDHHRSVVTVNWGHL